MALWMAPQGWWRRRIRDGDIGGDGARGTSFKHGETGTRERTEKRLRFTAPATALRAVGVRRRTPDGRPQAGLRTPTERSPPCLRASVLKCRPASSVTSDPPSLILRL